MDPGVFFSPEELAVWSSQREGFHLLYFTALGLKLLFLAGCVFTGIGTALGRAAERMAGWVYRRPSLAAAGRAVPALGGVRRVLERLGRGGSGTAPSHQWLVDIFYPVLFFALWAVLILPMDFYANYVHEHAIGLATTSPGLWWSDWFKDLAMHLVFAGLLGLGLFGLARRLERTWWLWLWGAVVGALLLWSYLSPYRARVFHQFEALPPGGLASDIGELMDRAGLALERVEVVDTSRRSRSANAYVMGTGPSRRVVLSDNLVSGFHPREIRVAVAHEVGHELHEHPARTWLVTAGAALLFLLLVRLILWRAHRINIFGLRPGADPAILPLVMLVLQLLFLANNPLSGWLDRREERQADQEALRLTNDPVAYCSLMIRLNRLNQVDPRPPPWAVWYFKHHPTTAERLQTGARWAKQHAIRLDPAALPLPAPRPPG